MARKRNLRQEDWPNFFDGSHLEYRFPTSIVNHEGRSYWSLTKRLSPTFNRIKPAILIDMDTPQAVCEDDTSYPGFSDDVLMNTDIVSSSMSLLHADLGEILPRYDVIFMNDSYVGIPLLRQCHENNVWLINLRALHYVPSFMEFSRVSLGVKHPTESAGVIATPFNYGVVMANPQWVNIYTSKKVVSVYSNDPTWSLMEE